MSNHRYIRHATLTTGHVRDSWRSEVDGEIVALLRPLLDRALTGEHVPIPAVDPACTMSGAVYGRCCVLTIWGPGGEVPVVTLGVATHSRCGARLWRELHQGPALPLATSPERCPQEPWCAARIEPGAAIYPEAMTWIGDFERCCAWAWIER